MTPEELTEKAQDFIKTPAGKITLGAVAVVGGVVIVRTIRKNQAQASATAGNNVPVGSIAASQPTTAGSGTGPAVDSATAQIEAQAKAQTDLIAAQTQAQKDLALFSLDLGAKQQAQTLAAQTAQFDVQYGGNDASYLKLAGITSISPKTGQALGTTSSPRTAPVPVSGSGLEAGVPSTAGQSILDAIGSALGLGIARGESRASVLARIQGYQADQTTQQAIATQQAADASYLQRLQAQYNLNSQATQQQYQQQQALNQQVIHAQEVANNPFSSIGNFVKSIGSLGGLLKIGRSTPTPTPTVSTNTTNPSGSGSLPGSPGGYALLEPAYRAVQSTGYVPITPTNTVGFLGMA